MLDFGERVCLVTTILAANNQIEEIQSMDANIFDCLKPKSRDLYLADSNVVCYLIDTSCTPPKALFAPLIKACFNDELSPKEKRKAYIAITQYFELIYKSHMARLKLNEATLPDRSLHYTAPPSQWSFPPQQNFIKPSLSCYINSDNSVAIYPDSMPYIYQRTIPNCLAPISEPAPEEVLKFLYNLSEGNINTVTILAELIALILSESSSADAPIVILADKVMHNTIMQLILTITENRIIQQPLSSLLHNKGLESLYFSNLNGCFANVVINDKILEEYRAVDKLSDVMNGRELTLSDPCLFKNIKFRNSIPFIYITEIHENYKKMRNIYSAKGITLAAKSELTLPCSPQSWRWLKKNFAIGGLKCLKSSKAATTEVSKISDDDIFESFVRDLCILDDELECPKAKLYDAYSTYFKKHYSGEPLTRIMFSKKFLIFGNFECVRPHRGKGEYLYCFKGICVDDNRLNALNKRADAPTEHSFDNFRKTLIELTTFTQK